MGNCTIFSKPSGPWKLLGRLTNTLHVMKLEIINIRRVISLNVFIWKIFIFHIWDDLQSLKNVHHPKCEKNVDNHWFQWKFGSSLRWDYSIIGWSMLFKISQMSHDIIFFKRLERQIPKNYLRFVRFLWNIGLLF